MEGGDYTPPPNQQLQQQEAAAKQAADRAKPVNENSDKANPSDKTGVKGPSPKDKQAASDKLEQQAKEKENKTGDKARQNISGKDDSKSPTGQAPDNKVKTDNKNLTGLSVGAEKKDSVVKNNDPKISSDKPAKKADSSTDANADKRSARLRKAIMDDTGRILASRKPTLMGAVSGDGGGGETLLDKKQSSEKSTKASGNKTDRGDEKENSDKNTKKDPSAQEKLQAADKAEQLAKVKNEKGNNVSSEDKPNQSRSDTKTPTEQSSTDKKTQEDDELATLEKRTVALGKHIDSLSKRQDQFKEEYNRTLEDVKNDFEKINSTKETIDNIGTVATMLVHLGSMVKIGATVMKSGTEQGVELTAKELASARKELLDHARDIVNDPVKDVAQNSIGGKLKSILGSGAVANIVEGIVKFDKPSTYAQVFTGNLEDHTRTVLNNLSRSYDQKNEEFESLKYNARQKLLQLNAQRDAINMSRLK